MHAAMLMRFGLVLMVTNDCNLRCSYCYGRAARPAGRGMSAMLRMAEHIARKAIDRALASIEPGGMLELGFSGGEPLLEAPLILAMTDYARCRAVARGMGLTLSMTTNGTVTDAMAWTAMTLPEMDLAVSHDGLPDVHNQHRRRPDGCATSCRVLRTIHRLLDEDRPFRVVMVVRPDNVESLPAGVGFLHGLGVPRVEPVLDLCVHWTPADVPRLEAAVAECARIWRNARPAFGISWFDETFARLTGQPLDGAPRLRRGPANVAVAPSGDLYPCERLIGADSAEHPTCLPGHVLDGDNFLCLPASSCHVAGLCAGCAVARSDGLLCALNRACLRERVKVTRELASSGTVDVFPEFEHGLRGRVAEETRR